MHDVKMGELKSRPNYECRRIFCLEQEKALVEYILNSSKMYYGLSTEQCRRLAYEMMVVNHIPHSSNWDELKMAGIERFQGFMARNDTLSL
jgi:hypothetical protein